MSLAPSRKEDRLIMPMHSWYVHLSWKFGEDRSSTFWNNWLLASKGTVKEDENKATPSEHYSPSARRARCRLGEITSTVIEVNQQQHAIAEGENKTKKCVKRKETYSLIELRLCQVYALFIQRRLSVLCRSPTDICLICHRKQTKREMWSFSYDQAGQTRYWRLCSRFREELHCDLKIKLFNFQFTITIVHT